MSPRESLWPSPAATNGEGLRSATFYGRFRRYLEKAGLQPSGLHVLRHSPPSSDEMPGRASRTCPAFLITAPWP